MPPTFTEKHLKTKKVAEEAKPIQAGRKKKDDSEMRISPQKMKPDINIVRDSDRSANISEHNTLDSNRMASGKKSFGMNEPSAQDLSVQQEQKSEKP